MDFGQPGSIHNNLTGCCLGCSGSVAATQVGKTNTTLVVCTRTTNHVICFLETEAADFASLAYCGNTLKPTAGFRKVKPWRIATNTTAVPWITKLETGDGGCGPRFCSNSTEPGASQASVSPSPRHSERSVRRTRSRSTSLYPPPFLRLFL